MLRLCSPSALGWVLVGAISLPAASVQSTTGVQRNGRWFTYNGQPVYLVGWDCQELACDPSINYTAALDLFVQNRLNKVRIWTYCYWDPVNFLHPWVYSNGRFNLDQWNPTYWSRVRAFVSAAQARNIVVEVTVFAPNNLDAAADWSSSTSRPAWNRAYNTNGVFASNANGHFSPQFYDLNFPAVSTSGKRLQDYQRALVDKTVAELGSFTNVYFEICNEFPVQQANIDSVYPWQRHWAQRINSASPRLVTCHAHEYVGNHTKGIQYFWSEPYVDVLDFHFGTSDPNFISDLLHAAQTKGKVLETNEGGDPYADNNGATRSAWGFFTSGGYYAFYEDDSSRIGSSGWLAGSQRLRALRDIVEKVRFWELSPVDASGNEYDGLVTQGPAADWQVLAQPGSQYVVYYWGTPTSTGARLQLPAGTYAYDWWDARNASRLASGTVSAGGIIPAPPTSSWSGTSGVALLVRTSSSVTNAPPVINFLRPAASATVSGTVHVEATAHDPNAGTANGSGISNVVLELRRGTTVVASRIENTVPYEWFLDTTAFANASYTLRATAMSTAAAGGTSSFREIPVTLSNGGNLPPTVQFTRPAAGATVAGTVAVNAHAHDADVGTADGSGIAQVRFDLLQGTAVVATHTDFGATYDWSLDTAGRAPGTYMLRATATSTAAAGGTSASASISITIGSAPSASSLIGHWAFNETSGTSAADSSSFNRDGTLVNGPAWTAGRLNGALYFDGTDDLVSLPSAILGNRAAYTLSVWFRTSASDRRTIYCEYNPSTRAQIYLNVNENDPGDLEFLTINDAATSLVGVNTGPSGLNNNAWHHAAMVQRSTGDRELFVDGVSRGIDRSLFSGPLSLNRAVIGSRQAPGSTVRYFRGPLDDVRIYNRALTASEVRTLAGGAAVASEVEVFSSNEAAESAGASCGATGVEVLLVLGLLSLRRRAVTK